MEKFQLSVLFKIIGIGSASGLVYQEDVLYIISDNSNYLYEYNIRNEKLNKIALVENAQENITKKDKPDFEAITEMHGVLHITGSGSTANRNQYYIYNPKNQLIENRDNSGLFQKIKTQLQLSDAEFNIEGYIINKDRGFFFQRGNGAEGKNGIIRFSGVTKNLKADFIPFELPKIKDIPVTFTDAVLVEGKIYFLASAENTSSTYDDGDVLGSMIGVIDLETMRLEDQLQISANQKFEGLAFYEKTLTKVEFLLCEDADSEVLETKIYKLAISLKP